MIAVPSTNDRPSCLIQNYSPAWELGTGLPISLAPGTYPITGEDQLQEVLYFRLNDTYRIESCWCRPKRPAALRAVVKYFTARACCVR